MSGGVTRRRCAIVDGGRYDAAASTLSPKTDIMDRC